MSGSRLDDAPVMPRACLGLVVVVVSGLFWCCLHNVSSRSCLGDVPVLVRCCLGDVSGLVSVTLQSCLGCVSVLCGSCVGLGLVWLGRCLVDDMVIP